MSPIIRILGATSLNDESRRIDLSGLRPGELLSILALNAGEFVYRDHLLDALYGEDLPRYPRIQLQNLVLRLRRHLTPWENMIRTEPNGYRFVLHEQVKLDIAEFERRCLQGGTAVKEGRWVDGCRHLSRALEMWGEPLLRYHWATRVAEPLDRLRGLREMAFVQCMEARLALGEHLEVVPVLRRVAADDGSNELVQTLLARALYHSGRQTEALSVLRLAARALRKQGLEASSLLRETEHRILNHDPLLHRPVPPPRSVRQLPIRPLEPVGGSRELGRITEALTRRTEQVVPVVIVHGPAGYGKTTLAVDAAHQVASDYPDGQIFAELVDDDGQPVATADLLGRILRDVGEAAVPDGVGHRGARLRSKLAGTRVLLVLDAATSAAQVRPLLPADPACGVIVTSRTPLVHLGALATRVRVRPLQVGDAAGLMARYLGLSTVVSARAAVAELTGWCAGMPMAVDLAAARLAGRSPVDLEREVPALRHAVATAAELEFDGRCLTPVLAATYRGLSDAARGLFDLIAMNGVDSVSPARAAQLAGGPPGRVVASLDELRDVQFTAPADPEGTDRHRYSVVPLVAALYPRYGAGRSGPIPASRTCGGGGTEFCFDHPRERP